MKKIHKKPPDDKGGFKTFISFIQKFNAVYVYKQSQIISETVIFTKYVLRKTENITLLR